ncbi:hypothetical protein FIBSPDRAFT_889540 [Athelia psychrophila]|uniref:Uncharacterized protein n=1 Tax=Athelia psychrophila TaxID=1759441 RepID=A0A166LX92_9AGAM|nr:hypothetical protein FIBSPDRAFT_889540 [Fibularhizoctonia sp. CBS 109695]
MSCAPAVAQFTAERKPGRRKSWAAGPRSRGTKTSSIRWQEADICNNTRVLAPEVTQGSYYHSEAHLIRQNIETCLPFPNTLVDIWHVNATGDRSPRPNSNSMLATEGVIKGLKTGYPRLKGYAGETWLRGAWPTNARASRSSPSHDARSNADIPYLYISDIPGLIHRPRSAHSRRGALFFDDGISETVNKDVLVLTSHLHTQMWPYSTNPIHTSHGRVRSWSDGLNNNDSHGPEGHYNPSSGSRSSVRSSTRGWGASRQGLIRVLHMIWRD